MNYPWPASALSKAEMALLFQVREQQAPRTPINHLLAQAVHIAYGQPATQPKGEATDDFGNTRQAA